MLLSRFLLSKTNNRSNQAATVTIRLPVSPSGTFG
uniref:Uncharacterized protein n=1 Tax=Anguilla anguilla TaxID=7936 RepID=A0A0E9UIE2_ANGAN